MKKIMIIDDSALMRRALSDIIKHTEEYKVAYTANNGEDAFRIISDKDDISAVLCDIDMPGMDGIALLKKVREHNILIPFIMVSGTQNSLAAIEAVKYGAAEFLPKPDHLFRDDNPAFRANLLGALGKYSRDFEKDDHAEKVQREVSFHGNLRTEPATHKVTDNRFSAAKHAEVRDRLEAVKQSVSAPAMFREHDRSPKPPAADGPHHDTHFAAHMEHFVPKKGTGNVLVALVCSTGGPKALQFVIPKLPKNLNAPVVMVQHMPKGFTASLANRLDSMSEVKVTEAAEGDIIEKGHVYIAKGGMHLKVRPSGSNAMLYFDDAPPIVGLKPCGNLMYESLCDFRMYDEIVCVVLTGMGADGTSGIKQLSKKQKIFVIAQDEASSTVYGMPKAIYEAGMVDVVCDLHDVANEITKKVGVR